LSTPAAEVTSGLEMHVLSADVENGVLRRLVGPKTEEITGDRRKLRKEELRNLCSDKYY